MRIDDGLLRKLNTFFIRLPANLGARVYRSTAFTHNSTGNWLAIDFSTERWDTGTSPSYPNGIWDVANADRLTAVKAGWHTISGCISWAASAAGLRVAAIWHSGAAALITSDAELNPIAGATCPLEVNTLYWMEAGEYVELRTYQDTGGNLDIISAGNYSPEFAIVRIP